MGDSEFTFYSIIRNPTAHGKAHHPGTPQASPTPAPAEEQREFDREEAGYLYGDGVRAHRSGDIPAADRFLRKGGSADIYGVHWDGSHLERLTDGPAFDDQGVFSPAPNSSLLSQRLEGR